MKNKKIPTLNDLCEFIVDCLHKTAPTQENGYPLIRTPNIKRGRLDLKGVFRVSQENYEIWTQRAIPTTNDLILAREATAGNVAIIKKGQTVCLGQRTVLLRPNQELVDPDFLCYFLLTPKQQGKLLAGETGATAKHVNMKDIRKLPLEDLPDLSMQRKIGRVLAAYDDLIENNRRRIELLEKSARLLYREWFVFLRFPGCDRVSIIDGIPQGWEKIPLGEVLTLQRGFDLPISKRIHGKYPIYASTGIAGYHEIFKIKAPGVVTGRSGSLGKVIYITEDFWPLNTTLWIKEFKKVNAVFAVHLLQDLKLENYNGGAAVPTLNRNDVHRIKIRCPPNELQLLFYNFANPIYTQIQKLKTYNSYLAQARDLLLPRLMNGEIEP